MEKDLEQIEADVVITITNGHDGMVCPYWECELDHAGVVTLATKLALDFVEDLGHGEVKYTIHDFRNGV